MSAFELLSLLTTIIAIFIPIYIFNKGEKSKKKNSDNQILENERLEAEKRRNDNANRVVDKYMQLHNSSREKGISALFTSGMSSLENEEQAKFVIEEINKRTGKSPLGRYLDKITDIGILHFFKNTTWEEINKLGGIEPTIEKINAENMLDSGR